MIRRRHDRHEYHARIAHPNKYIHAFPERRLADLPLLEGAPEDAGMVEHGAADDEGVPEMHAGHRGEGVDVVAAHPDAGRVVVANGIEEAIFGREKAGRHARV